MTHSNIKAYQQYNIECATFGHLFIITIDFFCEGYESWIVILLCFTRMKSYKHELHKGIWITEIHPSVLLFASFIKVQNCNHKPNISADLYESVDSTYRWTSIVPRASYPNSHLSSIFSAWFIMSIALGTSPFHCSCSKPNSKIYQPIKIYEHSSF